MGATLAGQQFLFLRSYNVMYEECGRVGGIISSEGRAEKKMMNSQRFFFGYFYFLGSRRMVMFVGFLTGGFA